MQSLNRLEEDIEITREKWEKTYKEITNIDFSIPNRDYRYIKKYLNNSGIFLELGCGTARNSYLLAKEGYKIVGLDLSLSAVKLAKDNFEKNRVKGQFVCGNMLNMPFKENVFHSIFAGGSIEHLQNTKKALSEIFRVLSNGGIFLATVPIVSLSQLTYGQLQGDIPDILLLRNICYFIQTKIFKNRFLIYGFQKSFTASKICHLFKIVGFSNIEYGRYETEWEMKFFKNKLIKKFMNEISKWRPFWPFIYIVGKKE